MGKAVRLRSRGVVAEEMVVFLLTYYPDKVMLEDQDFKVILVYTVCSRPA